jgi:anti-anti-sigma factor
LELLVRATGHADDITLLAAHRVPAPAPLELTVPAEAASVGRVRLEFERWLSAVGAGEDDALGLHHALGELVTNAVEHAYTDTGEPAERRDAAAKVSAALIPDGEVQATVGDHGRWRQARDAPERGRGLAMAGDFVDELNVDRAATGSTVTLRRRLSRPDRILVAAPTGGGDGHRRPGTQAPYTAQMAEQPGPRLTVGGPLDIETVDDLRALLLRATRGGTRTLTVDLTEVTHLASAAVQTLYEATSRSADQGSDLVLFAPPDGAAGHVLSLVALPHRTADPDGPQPEQLDPDAGSPSADSAGGEQQPPGQP